MRGQELVPGKVRLSLPVPSQAQKWPEGPEKAKIAGCCWWGKVGFTCQGEVGQAQPHTCSSLPFHLCLTSVRVIKEGSAPRGGLRICWGSLSAGGTWGHTQDLAGGACVPWEGTGSGTGSPLLSLQHQGDPAAPRAGKCPQAQRILIHGCSPALWDGWGSARREVQAQGLSPPCHTLSSTSREGFGKQLLSLLEALGVCREVGSRSQPCTGGSAPGLPVRPPELVLSWDSIPHHTKCPI